MWFYSHCNWAELVLSMKQDSLHGSESWYPFVVWRLCISYSHGSWLHILPLKGPKHSNRDNLF